MHDRGSNWARACVGAVGAPRDEDDDPPVGELSAGAYDWSHLACAIWPDRVREVCRTDRSIAIALGLEGLWETTSQASGKDGRLTREAGR